MKKIIKYVAIGTALLFIAGAYSYSHLVHSIIIAHSDYDKNTNNLYIDNQLDTDRKQQIISDLSEAKNRVIKRFGGYTASPIIIIVSSDIDSKKYGLGSSPGVVHIAPWQQYMIINANKAGVDVLAHELVHTEVANRLGYFNWLTKFPVWLNEGIAMQVDNRMQYQSPDDDITREEFSRVILLQKTSQFWINNTVKNINHYRLAKAAVEEILKNSEKTSLFSRLQKIRQGVPTQIAFDLDKTEIALQQKKH